MIKITNLHKFYNKGRKNEQHVLNDINLELGNTGLVCILGESGSGKTTLLNTIGGIDTFSGGVIDIDGKTIKNYNPNFQIQEKTSFQTLRRPEAACFHCQSFGKIPGCDLCRRAYRQPG